MPAITISRVSTEDKDQIEKIRHSILEYYALSREIEKLLHFVDEADENTKTLLINKYKMVYLKQKDYVYSNQLFAIIKTLTVLILYYEYCKLKKITVDEKYKIYRHSLAHFTFEIEENLDITFITKIGTIKMKMIDYLQEIQTLVETL